GLHSRFFSGKARGKPFDRVLLALAIPNLLLGKDAMQKTIAEARNGLRDARNVADVHSGSDNHFAAAATKAGDPHDRAISLPTDVLQPSIHEAAPASHCRCAAHHGRALSGNQTPAYDGSGSTRVRRT